MKLSDLRTCDGCGGPLFIPPGRCFEVLNASVALVTPRGVEIVKAAARQGIPLHRVEADEPGTAVVLLAEQSASLQDSLQLCIDCYHNRPVAEIARRRRERMELEVARGRAS